MSVGEITTVYAAVVAPFTKTSNVNHMVAPEEKSGDLQRQHDLSSKISWQFIYYSVQKQLKKMKNT